MENEIEIQPTPQWMRDRMYKPLVKGYKPCCVGGETAHRLRPYLVKLLKDGDVEKAIALLSSTYLWSTTWYNTVV